MAIDVVLEPSLHSFSKNAIPLILRTSLSYGAYFDIVISSTTDFYNSGNFVVLGKQRLFVDEDKLEVQIDMQSIYDAGFSYYDKIDLSSPFIQQPYGKIQRAKFEIQEYNFDGTAHDTYSAEFDLYRGGVPRQYEKTIDPVTWVLDNFKWLTWKPNTTVISKRQPEWLTLKLPPDFGVAQFDIKFVVTDIAGNTYIKTVSGATGGVSGLDIYFIPVGWNDNDLDLLLGVNVPSFYTVTAYEHGTANVIAETRKYILDYINRPFERFFMFTNSLGGVDTLRTIGEAVPKSTFEDVEADVNRSLDLDNEDAPNQSLETTEKHTKVINTGFKNKDEINWLRDFRLAIDVYEVETENMFILQPIRFVKKELIPSKDDQDLHAIQFEYKSAYDNSVFAPIPIHD